jgi:hypothetical protein
VSRGGIHKVNIWWQRFVNGPPRSPDLTLTVSSSRSFFFKTISLSLPKVLESHRRNVQKLATG